MLPASLGCFSNLFKKFNFATKTSQGKSILRLQGKLLSKDGNNTPTKYAVSHW